MKYAVEMDSVAMIYVHTKFNKDRFRHSTPDGRGDTQIAWTSRRSTSGKEAKIPENLPNNKIK
jgi:hypothetical protein